MNDQMSYTYTHSQLARFFDRVSLPKSQRQFSIAAISSIEQLEFLALLQVYTLVAIPFENLSLHYSQHRHISIDDHDLYMKIVESHGRGGYCMENNSVFGTVLRSLGYNIYPVGGRVKEGSYHGWAHMVNLVKIGEDMYMVDVGFGPNGPTKPIKLEQIDDIDRGVQVQAWPAKMRVIHKNIEENLDPNQRLWCYQLQVDPDSNFQDMYCFTELEYIRADFEIMNYYTSTNPKIHFTQKVVCSKMLLASDRVEICGAVILQDDIKYRIDGKVHRRYPFTSEEHRIEALEKDFNIKLGPSDREGIKGMISEIKKQTHHSFG